MNVHHVPQSFKIVKVPFCHCSDISAKQTLLSNVNTAISVTTAKSTRRMDGTNWLVKIPGWSIHMVVMNDLKDSQMTTLRKKLA